MTGGAFVRAEMDREAAETLLNGEIRRGKLLASGSAMPADHGFSKAGISFLFLDRKSTYRTIKEKSCKVNNN